MIQSIPPGKRFNTWWGAGSPRRARRTRRSWFNHGWTTCPPLADGCRRGPGFHHEGHRGHEVCFGLSTNELEWTPMPAGFSILARGRWDAGGWASGPLPRRGYRVSLDRWGGPTKHDARSFVCIRVHSWFPFVFFVRQRRTGRPSRFTSGCRFPAVRAGMATDRHAMNSTTSGSAAPIRAGSIRRSKVASVPPWRAANRSR